MHTVVDSHHKVLLAWAELRNKLSKAPRLITLDHHTDTSPPFRRFIKQEHNLKPRDEGFDKVQSELLENIDFANLNSVSLAIEKLNNDEHVIAAIKTDIISSAFVLAHNAADTDLEVYKEHKISCRTVTDHNTVLESIVLNHAINNFDQVLKDCEETALFSTPYILDIDLDYFNTFKSIAPNDSEAFRGLITDAALITVATEPDYVEGCALDKGLTSDHLLAALNENFLDALTS